MMRNFILLAVLVMAVLAGCTSTETATQAAPEEQILVLGASGKSGQYIIAELTRQGRNFSAATSNIERAREKAGAEYDWVLVDVRDPESVRAAMSGVTSIISALGATSFKGDNSPEFVDYAGVLNVVDAALDAGVQKIVLISASGVTNPDHPLNKLGNIMVWKLKGENYLRDSGLDYAIIRPGGLLAIEQGTHQIVLRQGDDLPYTSKLSVTSRADLAVISIAALDLESPAKVTFEAFDDRNLPADKTWMTQLAELAPD